MQVSNITMNALREDWHEWTLSIDEVLRFAARAIPWMTAASVIPYLLIWGIGPLPGWSGVLDAIVSILLWSAAAVAIYVVSALLHEGIHVLAMVLFARVPLSSLRFGARLIEGVLYVHSDRPMSARSYRAVLALPGLLQGVLPIVIGTIGGSGWLVFYGYIMLVSAVGDLAVLDRMRPLPSEAVVRDHPEKIGFFVRADSDQGTRSSPSPHPA